MGTQRRATVPPGGAWPGPWAKMLISNAVSLRRRAPRAGGVASRARAFGAGAHHPRRGEREGLGADRTRQRASVPSAGGRTLAQPSFWALRGAGRTQFLDIERCSAAAPGDGRKGRCVGHSAPCRVSVPREEECVHMGWRGRGSSARVTRATLRPRIIEYADYLVLECTLHGGSP